MSITVKVHFTVKMTTPVAKMFNMHFVFSFLNLPFFCKKSQTIW
ncbi:Uncharacterised protein [Mycobacterium tuberculosis]|nr:Uncharacterised protein [Mycobacterium tuberculosis]